MAIYQLNEAIIFPDPSLADEGGLLAVGGDLSPERILLAYSMGIFPWYSEGQPLLWWSPDPRAILTPDRVHISKSLRRVLRSHKFTVRFDSRFEDVIRNCSETRRSGQDGTWITDDMITAYCGLHEAGYAHSVETYLEEELVGGLYGISLGKAFFGESMFSHQSDASKVAFVSLSKLVGNFGFDFIDCQLPTPHLASLGVTRVSREDYLVKLHLALSNHTYRGNWSKYSS
ncbi:leucyl/phenylalanyl-tRNA--protein transferase [bacterium]|nr:leucyl/phenylalanyl-tRNA--protein transferase [bacterium]